MRNRVEFGWTNILGFGEEQVPMIRVMLVDDEEDALDLLEILLGQVGGVEVVGRYIDPLRALEALRSTLVDAVFLDNQMPGMTGTEAAWRIRRTQPGLQIVFTTAYAEYAVEAFEIQSTDYLLKPIAFGRLQRAVTRIGQAAAQREREERHAAAKPYIRSMGGFFLEAPRSPAGLLSWKTNKEKELCALLVHYGGRPVEAPLLIESLWPESELGRAKTYLYTCLSYLRRTLLDCGVPATVGKIGKGFAFLSDEMIFDAAELAAALEQATTAVEPDGRLFDRVADLYRGDYMEGCDYRWAAARQEELKARYIRVLRNWHGRFRERGNAALATDCLQRVLAVAPDSEPDGRALIRQHLSCGDRNEAMRVYRRMEQAVRQHLGVELEEETVQLARQMAGAELE